MSFCLTVDDVITLHPQLGFLNINNPINTNISFIAESHRVVLHLQFPRLHVYEGFLNYYFMVICLK